MLMSQYKNKAKIELGETERLTMMLLDNIPVLTGCFKFFSRYLCHQVMMLPLILRQHVMMFWTSLSGPLVKNLTTTR